MELYPLKVFLTVATERSFSRAGEKLLRTQPAISIAIQRLESDLKEKLIDRSGRELLLTDAGRVVLEYAKRFQNLEADLENSLRELKDNYAGRLAIGANESTSLYLIQHIEQYRRLFPKIKVQVRRSRIEQNSFAICSTVNWNWVSSATIRATSICTRRSYIPTASRSSCRPQHRFAQTLRCFHYRAGHGDVHRPQRDFALSRDGHPRVSAAQGSAEHGCGDADRGDHPAPGTTTTKEWHFCRACAWSRRSSRICCARFE